MLSILANLNFPGSQTFPLTFDAEMGFPLISADIKIETEENIVQLKEDLIIDFSNPMPLFMMKQHPSLTEIIQDGRIKIHDAYEPNGTIVAQGIYANKLIICNQTFENCTIGITDKMRSLSQLGFLGLPFFSIPVIFDFSNGIMIM